MPNLGLRIGVASVRRVVGASTAMFLLDQLAAAGVFAAVACSVSRLRAAWFGGAIVVRRSSDNMQRVIAFDFVGGLNVAAMLAFVGVGDGFVVTWLDQTGNNRHLQVAAALQPRIVTNGALEMVNGRPAIYFGGAAHLSCPSWGTVSHPFMRSLVFKNHSSAARAMIIGGAIFNNAIDYFNSPSLIAIASPGDVGFADIGPNESMVWTSIHSGLTSNSEARKNGVRVIGPSGGGASPIQGISLGSRNNSGNYVDFVDGWYSEFMTFASRPPLSVIETIERSQGAYFGIPVA